MTNSASTTVFSTRWSCCFLLGKNRSCSCQHMLPSYTVHTHSVQEGIVCCQLRHCDTQHREHVAAYETLGCGIGKQNTPSPWSSISSLVWLMHWCFSGIGRQVTCTNAQSPTSSATLAAHATTSTAPTSTTAQHSTPQHSAAQHGTQHHTAPHSAAHSTT